MSKSLTVVLVLVAGAATVFALTAGRLSAYMTSFQDIRSFTKKATLKTEKPLISFTFDDIPQSACEAAAVLKQSNCAGTFYLCMKLMDSTAKDQHFFSREAFLQLIDEGHEIASHTFSHLNCKTAPASEIRSDLEQNQQECERLTGVKMENFAYPFGEFDAASKEVTLNRFTSARSILPGINTGEIDLNLLKANKLYEHLPVENALKLIKENSEKKGWVIFYTHDVQASPSQYGCTPAYFKKVLKAAIESGAEIVTVKEALKKVAPL
ncbi:MAG: hypothetical protein EOO16_16255 [Chitinophagaceae bacterium]|nr:MAG: hypothetical protein EOO16_16255 [Chitinophagaceae bacterium]